MKKTVIRILLITTAIFFFRGLSWAQADKIEGVWFNDKKDAKIQIYKSNDGKFYGKIIWLKDGLINGKPKLDENNQKAILRTQQIMGMQILKGFQKQGDNFSDGTIYDPENGKTYDCKMTYKGKTLSIRGFIGISIIGRTTVWERAG
jgi:uncharacterized protein (DUF2147 family)